MTASEPTATLTEPGDSHDLARFGYKQELHRSLGSFSSFAAGFSYISIMTGVFQLFGFGFASGGPAMIWTWPLEFIGQGAVALCFAEFAGQFPLAGSVYQSSKQIASPATSWMAGWIIIVGSIATAAAVAVAYQVILPQVSLASRSSAARRTPVDQHARQCAERDRARPRADRLHDRGEHPRREGHGEDQQLRRPW